MVRSKNGRGAKRAHCLTACYVEQVVIKEAGAAQRGRSEIRRPLLPIQAIGFRIARATQCLYRLLSVSQIGLDFVRREQALPAGRRAV